jgi:general secretion pathway protein G
MCSEKRQNARRAFSLVEIMIVIVIIGLLAGVVTINVRSYLTRAKQNAVRQDIAVIVQGIDSFWAVYSRYPTNEEGLTILANPSEKMAEPPLSSEPLDPWGRPYQYNSPGTSGPYEVVCLGADGREGGDGADMDISSDNLRS